MTITLTPPTPSVAADAPWGRVIGTFNNSKVRLINDSPAGYFGVTANTLRVAWHAIQATPGTYQVTVSAPRQTRATFNVVVTAAMTQPPPPPPPASVQVNGSSGPIAVASGSAITASVANGPGNATDWLGVYATGASSGPGDPASWKYLTNDSASRPASGVMAGTVHLVVPAAAGQYEVRLFINNGFTVVAKSAAITVAAAAPPPPPPARTLVLSLAPLPASFPDNSPAGTVITTATVKYSDGTTPAAVTLTSSDPTFAKISGMDIVTARPLISGPQSSGGDDYTHPVTIDASDGLGARATARLFG